ncbi:arginine--tRNA ligase, cytoplasmic [Artemisia annua]|uniref:arginine--tRNA ligase n=1 Tax=Artemisia annua TaxID=35608 RepID=A0A2U1KV53_ARTAN|nr:arginine--tRNA ligase, cytoplasmic [Artemisia annua]
MEIVTFPKGVEYVHFGVFMFKRPEIVNNAMKTLSSQKKRLAYGYIHHAARSMTLDFQPGVIRHQMTVDDEGFGSPDDVPGRLGPVGLSAPGNISIAHTFRKRSCQQSCEGQRPSQRPRRQPSDASLSRPASERLEPPAHTGSSMPPAQQFVSQTQFATCHIPTTKPGQRTRVRPFPMHCQRPSQRPRRQPPDVPLCASSSERYHTATHATSSMPTSERGASSSPTNRSSKPSGHPQRTSIPAPALPDTPATPEGSCSSTAVLQQEVAAITEIPTAQITPPPGTGESIDKKNYQPEGSSKATRKQLFTHVHEQTSKENIQQAEATGQEDETMEIPPLQQVITEPEDKPVTQDNKKPKKHTNSFIKQVLGEVCTILAPQILCEYLYELCKKFNALCSYVWQVAGSSEETSKLLLCEATEVVMRKCFDLLGITPISGYIHHAARSMTLDFQPGVIRHQMTVDDEGFGSPDDVPGRLGPVGLSAPGNISIAHTFRKRSCQQSCEGQIPSQRPRRQPSDASLSRPASERLEPPAHTGSSMPPAQQFVSQTQFATCHIPTTKPEDVITVGITVPPVPPRRTSFQGQRTRVRPFPMHCERPSQRPRRQPPDVPLCASSSERYHAATHATCLHLNEVIQAIRPSSTNIDSRSPSNSSMILNALWNRAPALPDTPATPEGSCSSTAVLQQEVAAITEIPTAQITPPPGTDESIDKKNYQPEGSSKASHKQLFTHVHEQTSKENIQQVEATGQEDETMEIPPLQQVITEPEDKPITKTATSRSMTSTPQQVLIAWSWYQRRIVSASCQPKGCQNELKEHDQSDLVKCRYKGSGLHSFTQRMMMLLGGETVRLPVLGY